MDRSDSARPRPSTVGSVGRVTLPILEPVDSPPANRLNPNCVFVQRVGHGIYKSCPYCSLNLRSCIRFRGQWITSIAIMLVVAMLVLPLPAWGVYAVGGMMVALGV